MSDHKSNEAKEAERFLSQQLGKDCSAISEPDKIKWTKQTIYHVELCNTLAKIIAITRMPDLSKQIMLMKISNPGLQNMEIALKFAKRVTDIDLYEAEGKNCVASLLDKHSVQECIDRFNMNRVDEVNFKNTSSVETLTGNKLN